MKPFIHALLERDLLTSLRFADPMKSNIRNSELLIFEECSHAALYEKVDEFNQKTLTFLQRQAVRIAKPAAS